MFGFGRRTKGDSGKPKIESIEDLERFQKANPELFLELVPEYAEAGNSLCQVFLAQGTAFHMNRTDDPDELAKLRKSYLHFGTMAAESGNLEEQFNLSLFYSNQVDIEDGYVDDEDIENFRKAAYWMRKAADAGFKPAMDCVDNIESIVRGCELALSGEDEDDTQDVSGAAGESKIGRLAFDSILEDVASNRPFGDVKGVVEDVGFERATRFYAYLITEKILNDEARWQFILEELDGASQGNEAAKEFVKKTGVPESVYKGALDRSWDEVDGPGGPQQFLRKLGLQYMSDPDFMVRFVTSVVGLILEEHRRVT